MTLFCPAIMAGGYRNAQGEQVVQKYIIAILGLLIATVPPATRSANAQLQGPSE